MNTEEKQPVPPCFFQVPYRFQQFFFTHVFVILETAIYVYKSKMEH